MSGDSRSRRKIFFCLVVSFPAGWSFVSCLNDIQRMRNLRSIVKLPPWQRIVVPAWNDIDTLGQLCGAILPPRERSDGEIRDPSFRRESQSWKRLRSSVLALKSSRMSTQRNGLRWKNRDIDNRPTLARQFRSFSHIWSADKAQKTTGSPNLPTYF